MTRGSSLGGDVIRGGRVIGFFFVDDEDRIITTIEKHIDDGNARKVFRKEQRESTALIYRFKK